MILAARYIATLAPNQAFPPDSLSIPLSYSSKASQGRIARQGIQLARLDTCLAHSSHPSCLMTQRRGLTYYWFI